MWYIYLLRCRDGSYYTGITTDVEKRIEIHRSGKGSKYVARRGVDRVIGVLEAKDRSDASKREYEIKKLPRGQKVLLFTQGFF